MVFLVRRPHAGVATERLVQVDREQLTAETRAVVGQTLAKVMDAVNAAKDGRLIEDSEMLVFHVVKELERNVFETVCSCESIPRIRLFPAPKNVEGKNKHNKGCGGCVLAVDATGGLTPAEQEAKVKSSGDAGPQLEFQKALTRSASRVSDKTAPRSISRCTRKTSPAKRREWW
jgi:hypothetical protein